MALKEIVRILTNVRKTPTIAIRVQNALIPKAVSNVNVKEDMKVPGMYINVRM